MTTATTVSLGSTDQAALLESVLERAQREALARAMPVLTPQQFREREKALSDLREILLREVDYGVIPGTKNPTLLKPGAEKVCAYFGYVPRYSLDFVVEEFVGSPRTAGEPLFAYRIICDLEKDTHRVGSGVGACSSWETKYRYRQAQRLCPQCGQAAIIRGKAEYGGGWLCFVKKGGCGAKFAVGAPEIESQPTGPVPNGAVHDLWNTVLKMAKKRAYVDATLSATGLSQYFTQDMEDAAALESPSESISAGMEKNIQDMIASCELSPQRQSKLLEVYQIKTIHDLPAARYEELMAQLRHIAEQREI